MLASLIRTRSDVGHDRHAEQATQEGENRTMRAITLESFDSGPALRSADPTDPQRGARALRASSVNPLTEPSSPG